MTLHDFLIENNFIRSESCFVPIENLLDYGKFSIDKNFKGCVYAYIVEKKYKPQFILYVGQSEHTINKRLKEHSYGSKEGNHPKGNANAMYYKSFITKFKSKGYSICAWVRPSKQISLLGTTVSLSKSEESALLNLLKSLKYGEILLNFKTGKKARESHPDWLKTIELLIKKPTHKNFIPNNSKINKNIYLLKNSILVREVDE